MGITFGREERDKVAMYRDSAGRIGFMTLHAARMTVHAGLCVILQTGASKNEILEKPGFEEEKARWRSL